MVYVVGYRHSDAYIVPTISKKKEGEREEKQAKNGYWQNELDSLGIEQKEKKELDDKEQLEDLSDNIKQAMFQDYKLAYTEEGDAHIEKERSTVSVG
jgi:hypothetical protein